MNDIPTTLLSMKKQILIIEDDIDLTKILKAILEQNGYRVKVAFDGAEAFYMILKEVVDLIVTDLKMNWIEGDIIVRVVKAHDKTRHIPILVLTGLSPEEIAQYHLEGVETILAKPVDTRLLLDKIKEAFLRPTA